MARNHTLFTGQWVDLSFEEVAAGRASGVSTGWKLRATLDTTTWFGPSHRQLCRRASIDARQVRARLLGNLPTSSGRLFATIPLISGTVRSCPVGCGATAILKGCELAPRTP